MVLEIKISIVYGHEVGIWLFFGCFLLIYLGQDQKNEVYGDL